MAAEDIGAKLKVTGESSYSKAMREAAKNTKALDSELKLAEAQFKSTGDAQEYMSKKDKLLREQLEQQSKAVKTAKEMLQQLSQAGYDQNSSKVLEWRSRMAQAEQKVLELNNAINNNAKGLDEAGKAYDNLGESMQVAAMDAETARVNIGAAAGDASGLTEAMNNAGKAFGWTGLNDTLTQITEKVNAVIKRAVQMGKALWDSVVDASVWADDITTLSDQAGIDRQTIQKWQYASRFIDTSVDTITGSLDYLDNKLRETSTDELAGLAQIGVPFLDANTGKLRATTDVFWNLIDAMRLIPDATTRDRLAMTWFGKSAKDLNPLIKAGREEWDRVGNQAPLISEEKIDNLGTFNNSIENMNAQLEALKLDLLAELAPTFTLISDAIGKAAESFKGFLDSPEGRQALANLETAISGLVTDFTELDFGQIIQDASGTLTEIINSISTFLSDKDNVIEGIKLVGYAIAGLNLASVASTVGSIVANLLAIKGAKIGGAVTAATGGAAVGKAATVGASAGASAGITGFAAGVAGKSSFLAPLGTMLYMGTQMFLDHTEAGITLRNTGDFAKAGDALGKDLSKIGQNVVDFVNDYPKHVVNVWDTYHKTVSRWLQSGVDWIAGVFADPTKDVNADKAENGYTKLRDNLELLGHIADGGVNAYSFDDLDVKGLMEAFPNSMFAAMMNMWGTAENWYETNSYYDDMIDDTTERMAQELIDAINTQIPEGKADITDAITDTTVDSIDAASEAIGNAPEVMGEDIDIGLANGIDAKADVAIAAAETLANSVAAIMSSALKIESPSKVMRELGGYVGEGFALGIEDTTGLVGQATNNMIRGIDMRAPVLQPTSTPAAYGASDMPSLILSALSHMTVQIDGHEAGTVILPTIEELMTNQMMSRRYE